MEKKLAMKWVRALRSGKFKQTKEKLRKETNDGKVGYCCLGVLATICKIEEDVIGAYGDLSGEEFSACDVKDCLGAPNEGSVKVRHGKGYFGFDSLAEANDGGASFRAIATWIEKNYKKL